LSPQKEEKERRDDHTVAVGQARQVKIKKENSRSLVQGGERKKGTCFSAATFTGLGGKKKRTQIPVRQHKEEEQAGGAQSREEALSIREWPEKGGRKGREAITSAVS